MEAFALASERLDIDSLIRQLDDPAAGALVLFHGRVRNHHQGRAVTGLDYHAHMALAAREGSRLLDQLQAAHPTCRIVARHRIGMLPVGEVAFWVGVTSAHRAEAFAACEDCVRQVKSRVPIWKKEHYSDASTAWLEQTVLKAEPL